MICVQILKTIAYLMLYFILTSLEFNFNLLEQMYKIYIFFIVKGINAYSFFHA